MNNKQSESDPFIIIRDHRSKQAAQRLCLRLLDINTIESKPAPVLKKSTYSFEDKENCHFSLFEEDESKEILRKIPTPNNKELINYDDYDEPSINLRWDDEMKNQE